MQERASFGPVLFPFKLLLSPLSETKKKQRFLYYSLAFICFFLGVFSKATVLILPFVLVLFIAFAKGRSKEREIIYAAPFFLLMIAAYMFHKSIAEKLMSNVSSSFVSKIAVAVQIPVFYLSKIIFSYSYSANYPDENVIDFAESFADPSVIAAVFALSALFAAGFFLRKKYPQVLFSVWLYFLPLIPVLHFFSTHPVVADRYAYLSSYAVFFLMATFLSNSLNFWRKTFIVIIAAVTVTWSIISYNQNKVWQSNLTLWENAIKIRPTTFSYNNLAAYYYSHGEIEKSDELLAKARELDTEKFAFHSKPKLFILGGTGR